MGGAYHIDPALGGRAYTTELIMTTKMVDFRIQDFLRRGFIWTAHRKREMTHGPHPGTRSSDSKLEGGANDLTLPTKKHVYQTPKLGGAFTIALLSIGKA